MGRRRERRPYNQWCNGGGPVEDSTEPPQSIIDHGAKPRTHMHTHSLAFGVRPWPRASAAGLGRGLRPSAEACGRGLRFKPAAAA